MQHAKTKLQTKASLAAQFFQNQSITKPQSFDAWATNASVFINLIFFYCFSEDDQVSGSALISCRITHSPLKLQPSYELSRLSILLVSRCCGGAHRHKTVMSWIMNTHAFTSSWYITSTTYKIQHGFRKKWAGALFPKQHKFDRTSNNRVY
jgi:hypothetical protein